MTLHCLVGTCGVLSLPAGKTCVVSTFSLLKFNLGLAIKTFYSKASLMQE